MGRIAVLDQQTIDKIAAGEVVERPASVVKELVENAIDAGATQVTVEVRDGGVGYLRITDNGSGIEKDDIPLAFLRHSTSKIRSADDLSGVSSLGFRGEALSSIAAVAMVELITKTRGSVTGSRCCIEGGVQKSLEDAGAPDGTTFVIRNLFYNTPARKKFLKSSMSEASAIHELMTHLSLSHPEVSFRVMIEGQERIHTAGNGSRKDVIYHIYGRETALRLIEVEREEGPLHVSGYIGKPEISRGNRNYENYFVNGRYVKSNIIAKGVEDGYRTFMMQHRYPFACLDIRLDGKFLDVNVHPSKMELRFSNQNLVYDFLLRTVKDALSGRELIPEVRLDGPEQTRRGGAMAGEDPGRTGTLSDARSGQSTSPNGVASDHSGRQSAQNGVPAIGRGSLPDNVPMEKRWKTPSSPSQPVEPRDKNLDYFMEQMRKRVEERHRSGVKTQSGASSRVNGSEDMDHTYAQTPSQREGILCESNGYEAAVSSGEPQQLDLFDGKLLSKEAAASHTIIGQLFDTYWLVQYADKLYIIDQHAAHEKVLYERFMKELSERKVDSQLLSPPIILNLSMQEEQLYLKFQKSFADMGFEIDEFGDHAYAVRAVPSNLPGIDRQDILMELLDSLSEVIGSGTSESLLDKMASMACKAAVKGKHRMSTEEAKALIDELLTLENPYNCPHGRPTIISMSRYELEKKFKRIV
ncbi:MAG: DNA mismatch repair endonuclease MutL [Lachnospiraceae bacterium]|nr:DNA mismatch repair endonuclease MutL [Lachnospiraceae bacterium]